MLLIGDRRMIMKLLKDSKVRGTYDAYKVTEFIKYLAYKGVINFETYSIISKCLYGRVANYSEYEHHSLLFYMLMNYAKHESFFCRIIISSFVVAGIKVIGIISAFKTMIIFKFF